MLDETVFIDRALDLGRGALRATSHDEERRAYKRRPYHGWIAYLPLGLDGPAPMPILLRCQDLSAGGLNAMCGRAMEADQCGTILMARSDGEHVLLDVRIAHCRCRSQMDFMCGVAFIGEARELTLDDFRYAAGALPEVGEVVRRKIA